MTSVTPTTGPLVSGRIRLKATNWPARVTLRGVPGPQGARGDTGLQGLSAYDVAVANGFAGTQDDWLISLGVTTVSISAKPGNTLTTEEDGVYAAPPQLASAQW